MRRRAKHAALPFLGLLASVIIGWTVFVTLSGGDWMPGSRYLVPVVPAVAAFVGIAWSVGTEATSRAAPRSRAVAAAFVAAACLLLGVSFWTKDLLPRLRTGHQEVVDLAAMGRWFERTLPRGTEVATYADGALPYEAGSGIRVIDMLGLTDEFIARHGHRYPFAQIGHAAYDWDYIRRRDPAIVAFDGGGFLSGPLCSVPLVLGDQYVPVTFEHVGGPPLHRWADIDVRRHDAAAIVARLQSDPAYRLHPCPNGPG
jgi:hypothetical protein